MENPHSIQVSHPIWTTVRMSLPLTPDIALTLLENSILCYSLRELLLTNTTATLLNSIAFIGLIESSFRP
jgi:hypothetical protein